MKRTRIMIVAILLFALLLSSCGQIVPKAAQTALLATAKAPGAAEFKALSASREAPTGGHSAVPRLAADGKSAVTKAADDLFRGKFEGTQVQGSAEAVDGVYRMSVTETDGEAWHIKLESNYPTMPGNDYRITYHFRSDVAGTVKFGDFQEFEVKPGDNSVTAMMVASEGTSYLDLQLGLLPAPFTVDFTGIEMEEYADEVEYEDALTSPVNFEDERAVYEKHDQGYGVVFDRRSDSVTLDYVATSWDNGVWKSRLYVHTGLVPEAGTRYHVAFDMAFTEDTDFEVLFNSDDQEKGYGALYGQHLNGGESATVESVVTGVGGDDAGELVVQFSLGNVPEGSKVDLSNFTVEKITDHYTSMLPYSFALDKEVYTGRTLYTSVPSSYKELPLPNFSYEGTDTVYEGHDDDYVVSLKESASSATLNIEKAPEADRGVWKAKLFAATGVELEAGTTYRIRYDLSAARDQAEYEACFDGSSENAYGALYGRSLKAGGTDSVEYIVTPEENRGPLTLRLQLGKTDTTAGNSFTLSNLSVEKLTPEYQDAGTVPYDTGSSGNVSEEHYDGIEQTLSASGSTAALNITAARSGGGVWSSKLLVQTGVTPEAGERYRVSLTLAASGDTGEFEILYQNTGAEELYGGQWGLSGAGEYSSDFTAPASGCGELALVFQLGNAAAGASISVSDIQIRKVSAEDTELDLGGFTYPVTTGGGTIHVDDTYVPQSLSLSAQAIAWDGSEASASLEGSGAELVISKGKDNGGVWSTRLQIGTGVVLEPGAGYQLNAKLDATDETGDWELLLSNSQDEDDSFNQYGSGYGFGQSGNGGADIALNFTAPTELSEYKELVLRFQLGNSAENTVTVSDISLSKLVPAHDETSGGSTEYNSFDLETNFGTAATLTGDGASATATVTAPGEDWHIKLYAKTGVTLESGKTYRIDMAVSGDGGWNVAYKRAEGKEEDFNGAMTFGDTVSNTVTPTESGTLEIVLKLGAVKENGSVTVSGIRITEIGGESLGDNLMTAPLTTASRGNVNFWAHEDYAAALSGDGSSASLAISNSPADGREAWKVKLFVETGITLEAGKHYRISADVSADAETDYEICYNNGAEEKGVGALYGLHATPASRTEVFEATPENAAELILQFNLGWAASPCTVTVSNVKVEVMAEGAGESVLPSFRYDSVGSFASAADEGYIVSLDKGASSAAFHIHQAPAERNPWNVKLNVRTGFTPEKGKGYRVSFDLETAKPQGTFELFLDGAAEGTYGQFFGPALGAGKTNVSHIIYPGESRGELVLQLRLGKTDGTDGNDYTVSSLKIEEVSFTTTSTPETRVVTELWTHDGYSSRLDTTHDKATVRIEKTPSEGMEPWKTKLFVETGVTLKAGQKYRISMNVKSIIPAPIEICFNNGGEEKGLGAMFGLMATPTGQPVEYVTYAKQDTDLVIQLSLGNCTAPNSIILGGLAVEKAGEIDLISDTVYTF